MKNTLMKTTNTPPIFKFNTCDIDDLFIGAVFCFLYGKKKRIPMVYTANGSSVRTRFIKYVDVMTLGKKFADTLEYNNIVCHKTQIADIKNNEVMFLRIATKEERNKLNIEMNEDIIELYDEFYYN